MATPANSTAGTLPRDANRNAIQVAATFSLNDGTTGSPISSPVAAGTSNVTLVFPTNAIGLVVIPSAEALLSKGGGTFRLLANQSTFIPGIQGDSITITRGSSLALDFAFNITR